MDPIRSRPDRGLCWGLLVFLATLPLSLACPGVPITDMIATGLGIDASELALELTTTARVTSTEFFDSCSGCNRDGGRDYPDIPTAPEHPFIVTFKATGLGGDLVESGDVRAFLVHKSCGNLAFDDGAFEVDFATDGLGLTGRVADIPSRCIESGQRSRAFWEVIIQRTGSTGIRVEWEISYVDYRRIAQPLRANDPTE